MVSYRRFMKKKKIHTVIIGLVHNVINNIISQNTNDGTRVSATARTSQSGVYIIFYALVNTFFFLR